MTPIDLARSFVRSTVQQPALEHPLLADELKSKVKHSEIWLDRFQRVGDLLTYLKRFSIDKNDPTYLALHELGLQTFEDIVESFESKFSLWANDCTRQSDFVIGERYSVFQILIYAGNYDTRSGGMFVLEADNTPSAVVIKATLDGDDYPNKWLQEPNRLKYYLKSIGGKFGEHFKTNAAILENPSIPILTFVREKGEGEFIYQGIFNLHQLHKEADGSKWFDLERSANQSGTPVLTEYAAKQFDEKTQQSMQLERNARLKRLASAPKIPERIQVVSTSFNRNPDVVAEVLYRAAGSCEQCKQTAPFLRRSDGTPYLEVHHRLPLADNGEDTVANAIALCPNCHRKAHFGSCDACTTTTLVIDN